MHYAPEHSTTIPWNAMPHTTADLLPSAAIDTPPLPPPPNARWLPSHYLLRHQWNQTCRYCHHTLRQSLSLPCAEASVWQLAAILVSSPNLAVRARGTKLKKLSITNDTDTAKQSKKQQLLWAYSGPNTESTEEAVDQLLGLKAMVAWIGCVLFLLLFMLMSNVLLPCVSGCSSIRVHQWCQFIQNVSWSSGLECSGSQQPCSVPCSLWPSNWQCMHYSVLARNQASGCGQHPNWQHIRTTVCG
jgi:hypothetical protein